MDAGQLRAKLGVKAGDALPSRTTLGGFPLVYYVTERGSDWLVRDTFTCCHNCVTDDDIETGLVEVDVRWEGGPLICDVCGAEIESAYGGAS